jgi:hypothetical protein
MNDREIFEAAEQLNMASDTLRRRVRHELPQIEDALHGTDEHPAGAPTREAFALLCLSGVAGKVRDVLYTYDKLSQALGGAPRFRMAYEKKEANADGPAVETLPSATTVGPWFGISFARCQKLREPCVVEGIIEVLAPLKELGQTVDLRLEVRRGPAQPDYEVAVYREATVLIPAHAINGAEQPPQPHEERVWVKYDLIRSPAPTAALALERVLGFLEMRCA